MDFQQTIDRLTAIRKLFNESLIDAINLKFQSSDLSTLSSIIFLVCFIMALAQLFRNWSNRKAFTEGIYGLAIKTWLVLALINGGTYVTSIGLDGIFGSRPMYIGIYNLISKTSNDYAEKLSSGADEAKLAYTTQLLMDYQDNIIMTLYECDKNSTMYKECIQGVLRTGSVPESVKAKDAQKEDSSLWSSALKYTGMQAMYGLLKSVAEYAARMIANPGLFLLPIIQWLVSLLSAVVNFGLLMFWGFAIAFATLMTQLVTPFLVVPGFEQRIKNLYLNFFSTAFYGFAMKMIVWISNILLDGMYQATQKVFEPQILSLAGSDISHSVQGASVIQSTLMANYFATLAIICLQIVAVTKIPKFAKSLFFLSLSEVVGFVESLISDGMGAAFSITKYAALAGAAVATGGAALAAGGASAIGGSAAGQAGAKLASSAVSKVGSSVAKNVGSNIANAGKAAAKGISKAGNNATSLLRKDSFLSKMGNNATQKISSAVQKSSESVGQKSEGLIKKGTDSTSNKIKNAFQKNKEKNAENNDNTSNENMAMTQGDSQGKQSSKKAQEQKDGLLKTVAKNTFNKKNATKMVSSLYSMAENNTKAGIRRNGTADVGILKTALSINPFSQKTTELARNAGMGKNNEQSTLNDKNNVRTLNDIDRMHKEASAQKIAPTYESNNNGELVSKQATTIEEMQQSPMYQENQTLKNKIFTGTANEDEMKKYRQLNDKYEFGSEEAENFKLAKEQNPEFAAYSNKLDNEHKELIDEMARQQALYSDINDEKMNQFISKHKNGEISKEILQNDNSKIVLESYAKKLHSQNENLVQNLFKQFNSGKKVEKSDLAELDKMSTNSKFVKGLSPESVNMIEKMLNIKLSKK